MQSELTIEAILIMYCLFLFVGIVGYLIIDAHANRINKPMARKLKSRKR